MPQSLYPPLVYTAVACFGLSSLPEALASRQFVRSFYLCGTVLTGILVALLLWTMHRLPLFGAYEALIYTAFVTGVLECSLGRNNGSSRRQSFIAGILTTLILLPLIFRTDLFPRPNFFLYADLNVACFFFCRLTALGMFTYAAISYLAATTFGGQDRMQRNADARGRNHLLLGAVIFLLSEFAGSLWCYEGWGDSWRWSANFFRSSMFFLLIMLGLHLPPKWKHAHTYTPLIGGVSCLSIVVCVLIRQLMES